MLKTIALSAVVVLTLAGAAYAQSDVGKPVRIQGCVKFGPEPQCVSLTDQKTGMRYDISAALPKPTHKPLVVNVVGRLTPKFGICNVGPILRPATLSYTKQPCKAE